MPELPEVETIVRGLAPELSGRAIAGVQVYYPGALVRPCGGESRLSTADDGGFAARVTGRAIRNVRRRAKLLLMGLGSQSASMAEDVDLLLAVHLKMTGSLWIPPKPAGGASKNPDSHTRIVFSLDDGRELHFRDPRKFGYCLALSPAELAADPFFSTLGPEPLEVSDSDFAGLLRPRNRNIKALLLDQTVIAGVGNIYADESLFRAGIRPQRRGAELSLSSLKRLHAGLQDVLRQAIAENGSSFRDFVDHKGDSGAFQNLFRVYGRGGQPCAACGQPLASAVVAGRTTVWCPRCQK